MGESPTKPILRLMVGHRRRGLWGWVWGWAGGNPVPPHTPGADLEAAAAWMCGFNCVRSHPDRAHFQDPALQASALPSTWSLLRPYLRAWIHSCGSTFSFRLGSERRAVELLALATSREAVRGLWGASLDAGLLLFLFEAGRPLYLLSVCSVERSAQMLWGGAGELKMHPVSAELLTDHQEVRTHSQESINEFTFLGLFL